jgi:hypothetical protein
MSSMFVVSALSLLATPLYLALSWKPPAERPIQPTVAQLLVRNEALAVAAQDARQLGWDLTDTECEISDDNARWVEYSRSAGSDLLESIPELGRALQGEAYWAVHFGPRREPGPYIKDGDAWVFVRRSDLKILGRM